MNSNIKNLAPMTLALNDIADWRKNNCINSVIARVPSLQRGLVWEPQQIELLWDSIFRGFPFGSIVLAEKIAGQNDKGNTGIPLSGNTTHHILDGQQRCYAIALGFENPWVNKIHDDVVLWLDIAPEKQLDNSVRKYLFRVSTKAHPWGFKNDNQSSPLQTKNIRAFLQKYNSDTNSGRPLPEESSPYDAGFPVPLAILFENYDKINGTLNWDAIEGVLKTSPMKVEKLPDNINREQIESGIRIAAMTNIVALLVPSSVDAIEDIGQIFQRLNGQGTPLDNEELAYSMIKAYWPDVESVLSQDNFPKHITEARLISMAARVALTGEKDIKIPDALDSNRIRNIFKEKDSTQQNSDSRTRIKEYFNNELIRALQWIDEQFLYDRYSCAFGIPAYLRSSIAWNSRDVFAWLMVLARRFEYKKIEESTKEKILALALSIHWFGNDKAKAVEFLLPRNLDEKSILKEINTAANGKLANLVYLPIKPDELNSDAIPLSSESNEEYLKIWSNFWSGVVIKNTDGYDRPEDEIQSRREKYGYFVEKIRVNRELLVYVQRDYFSNQFGNFDPSNKLVWKGHNRPWDYDHILPSDDLYATGRGSEAGDYHGACKAWQQSIGNLVAVDFTFNRSAQATIKASEKYSSESPETDKLSGCFVDIRTYDLILTDTKNFEKSMNFVLSAKKRLVNLYRNWYQALKVDVLL